MKKVFFFISMALLAAGAGAQKPEDIKNQLVFKKFNEAKAELDKAMTNPKFNSKAEAYLLKTTIYATLGADETKKNTEEARQLTMEAEAAFKKYKEMDPKLDLIDDPIYRDGPSLLYNNLFNMGQADYKASKWNTSFEYFKKVVELSDALIAKKFFDIAYDTAGLIYAGLSAQNSKNVDEAAKYYKLVVDNKLADPPFEDPYRFLVIYYFTKKDYPTFEKYKALGRQTFPNSEYFLYDKIDFAIGLVDDYNEKIKSLEEVLASDPENYRANELLGELIFSALYPSRASDTVKIDAVVMEPKMIAAFNKAAALRPDSIDAFLLLGDHYYKKSEAVKEMREAHVDDMKKRTKPGTASSKEDLAKRDLLDKQLLEAYDLERVPYERAAVLFAAKTTLTRVEKQQYKNLAGKIADIYTYKRIQAKGKPADIAKFTAEEKKWNELYEAIK